MDNILAAFNEIVDDVAERRPLELTPGRIARFNEQVLKGLDLDEDVVAGQIRRHSVGVLGYRGAPAEDCEYLLAAGSPRARRGLAAAAAARGRRAPGSRCHRRVAVSKRASSTNDHVIRIARISAAPRRQ